MTYLMSIFLGFVQGVAEFLPISSSGHLSILQNLMHLQYSEEDNLFFDVLLHLGTLISVCFVYRKELQAMIVDTVGAIRGVGGKTGDGARFTPSVRTVVMIVIATLPLIVILPFNGLLDKLYSNTLFIGFALIITGGILFTSDKLQAGRKNAKSMTVMDAVLIGIAQAIAVIPGVSRSGSTISVGVAQGLDRNFAVKFSFLVSIPAVLGANIISLIKAISRGINSALIPMYLVGMLVAMVSGYFAIRLIKLLMEKGKFGKFAYYCWAVGAVVMIVSFIV